MTAKQTRADLEDELHRAVRAADHFVVYLFVGPGNPPYRSKAINNLADARLGCGLVERHFRTTRQAMVYAIGSDGSSTMVPRTFTSASMENATMTKPANNLSALAAKITAPTSTIMQAAKEDATLSLGLLGPAPGALQDGKGNPLPKAALRKLADQAATQAGIKIAPGVRMSTSLRATSAPDAGKKAVAIDLTMPAHLMRGTPENASWLKANKEKGAAAIEAARKKADDAKTAEKVTKEQLRAQVSAAKPAKEKVVKAKKEKKESPDAVKPIVPQGGAAMSWWNEAEAKALKGTLPAAPDFTAETHKPYRDRLKDVVTLAKAGDIAGLKANAVRPLWNSQTQIVRYRELCLIALHAKAGKTYKVPGDHRDATSTKPAKEKPAAQAKATAKKASPKKAAAKAAKKTTKKVAKRARK